MDTLKNILTLIISLSTVLGIFTGIINKAFSKKLKPIEKRIEQSEENSMKHDLGQLRYLIVSFSNDLRNGITKSRFQYDAVFGFIDEYEEIINKLNIRNGLFEEEKHYIQKRYQELTEERNS